MGLGPSPDVIRQRVAEQCNNAGIALAQLSRILGHGDPYLARFVRESVPYELSLADRIKAAEYLGIPGPHLGAPAPPTERHAFAQRMRRDDRSPRLRAEPGR